MKEGIVGHGDIASVLKPREGLLFFASGVSNSSEASESEYQRERDLLLKQDREPRLVYFGSLSIFYTETRYSRHKREMEDLVRAEFPRYCIVRLGNITFGENPHTIVNFFRGRIRNNEPFEVRDEYRYLIGKEEFLHWINMIPDFNVEMNITGRMKKVEQIVEEVRSGNL